MGGGGCESQGRGGAQRNVTTAFLFCNNQRTGSYFELLLRHAAVVWVQELENVRNQVSAAEVVGSQCAEQNILSLASNLTGGGIRRNVGAIELIYYTLCVKEKRKRKGLDLLF